MTKFDNLGGNRETARGAAPPDSVATGGSAEHS